MFGWTQDNVVPVIEMKCDMVVTTYYSGCRATTREFCGKPARKEWYRKGIHVASRWLCEKHSATPRRENQVYHSMIIWPAT